MTFIKALALAFFLNLDNLNSGFDGRQVVRELGTERCPYTNFCSAEASKQNLNDSYIPCCRPCFCDDDCWELDNCCPDKEGTTPAPLNILPCKSTKVKSARLRKRGTRTFGSGYFRVIDTCPSTEENVTLIGLCMTETQPVLEDYVWVSDYTTGKIYQNLHCAKCHKIDNYVSWQIKTTCEDILQADFVNVAELLLSDTCDIRNTVPISLETKVVKYECFNVFPSYTECNELPHAQLGNLSKDIVAACEHSTWVYLIDATSYPFKNIFWYILKHGLDAKVENLCERAANVIKGGATQEPFSVIINYLDKPRITDDTNEDLGCHRNEVIDKYMIIWPQTNLKTMNNDYSVGKNVQQQFSQYVAWEKAGCGVMKSYVKGTNETTPQAGYLVWYDLRTTPSCQPDFIQQQASEILGKTITVNITGDILLILVHPGKRYEKDLKWMRQIYLYYGGLDMPSCKVTVRLNYKMFCPKIELKVSYVEMFSAAQEKEKFMFLSLFEIADTDTIYVCLEDYFAIMSLTNACVCLRFMETVFFFGFIFYNLL